jgi:hypothetical protein
MKGFPSCLGSMYNILLFIAMYICTNKLFFPPLVTLFLSYSTGRHSILAELSHSSQEVRGLLVNSNDAFTFVVISN